MSVFHRPQKNTHAHSINQSFVYILEPFVDGCVLIMNDKPSFDPSETGTTSVFTEDNAKSITMEIFFKIF